MNYGVFEVVGSGHRSEGHSRGGYKLVMGDHGGDRTQFVGLLEFRWDSPGTIEVLEFLQNITRERGLT